MLLLVGYHTLMAQIDNNLQKEVEVIKAYQPSISDAYKIGTNPRINDTINYSPTFEYRIFSKDFPVKKTINHLPAVKLGTPPKEKSNTGYLKGGFGNAWTPTADLFINNNPSRNTDFSMQLHHFSSRPDILLNNGLKVNSPYSNNIARIFVRNNFRKSVLEWEMQYQRDGFRYYGFPDTDSLLYLQNEKNSSTLNEKQVFNLAEGKVRLKNITPRAQLDYNVLLGYNYFWNATGQAAHQASYNGIFTKPIRKFNIQLDSKFEYFNQNGIVNNIDNTLDLHQFYHASISPQIIINEETYQLQAGFNLGTIIGSDSSLLWHISPKIYFAYHPIQGIMTLFVGTDGGFNPNGYRQMVTKNPYVNYNIELSPSEKAINFYGGIKGKLSRKISYLFDVDYSINQNEAFYYHTKNITLTDTIISNTFSVLYDQVNQLRFGGNIYYSSNSVTVNLKGNYYRYQTKTLTTLPHLPDFDISLNTSIQFTSRIKGNIDATVVGERDALYHIIDRTLALAIPSTFEIQTLKPILELNLGLDYSYSKQLNFFLDARNVLNQNYEIWHGYNQQRLLIILGARFVF